MNQSRPMFGRAGSASCTTTGARDVSARSSFNRLALFMFPPLRGLGLKTWGGPRRPALPIAANPRLVNREGRARLSQRAADNGRAQSRGALGQTRPTFPVLGGITRYIFQRGLAVLSSSLLLVFADVSGLAQLPQYVIVNGGFEDGLKGWRTTGNVHVETNHPLEGKASAVIGPGAGSLVQRIETGSGNDLTVLATIQAQHTNGWVFAVRFLDEAEREVMRVDSAHDMDRGKGRLHKFSHYMKEHPLTHWIEIVLSKDSSGDPVVVDEVGLQMTDENAAGLHTTCDLDQEMQPFWMGKKVYAEAVLLLSREGNPATGQLMFHPSRILSVQDYGLSTNYAEGVDYTVDGRKMICTASSRLTRVREEDLPKGELKWPSPGGKQVMVTYEHEDTWNGTRPTFVGDSLPNTIKKLQAHAPLKVVAYGDSITHGVGESRLSHIRPFLPPWPELFVHRLKAVYQDQQIQLYNSAQSGADSEWGKKYAGRMVASLNPDLVLIAFGQNDFWRISADSFANNIAEMMKIVRQQSSDVEFLLVSTMRFDPAYTSKPQYWNVVGEYATRLKAMTRLGVQFVDMTAISEAVFSAKKPKDCLNDPLHPNDYLARWYAQSLAAALDPGSGETAASMANSSRGSSASNLGHVN